MGAGPTGLTAANLLGEAGVPVTVVERHASTSDEAKAISLDGESIRTLQRAGLSESLADVFVPGTGTRYYGHRGDLLFAARGPSPPVHGHAFKNPFAQPDLERGLLRALERFPHVEVVFDTEVVTVRQNSRAVIATVQTPDGTRSECRAMFLLGADGGRSTVRKALGIEMRGRSFGERWLVVDTVRDFHDQRYGIHVGDPARPTVIIPGRDGRCRYEFLLADDEPTGIAPSFELVAALLTRYRGISPSDVERSIVYSFHALNAARWSEGRIFLSGDAAHMMPPFAGQGLNSGIRDVANLTWKLSDVRAGRAHLALLRTYEAERRPHAQAMIDLSVQLGAIVMTRGRRRARIRDGVVGLVTRVPAGRRWLEEMRYAPRARYTGGLLVGQHPLVGTLLPQPNVLMPAGRPVRLDDVLGPGYAILAVELGTRLAPPVPIADPLWQRLDPTWVRTLLDERFPRAGHVTAIADFDGTLRRALRQCGGSYVLVRPDRFVAAVFGPASVASTSAALSRLLGLAPAVTAASR
ncbi:MAG: bifunctional 3-(3-hydroxy-phenyl)propionate/3-hydroxycinnamic acid hydroxylase [Actinomycetota bacterium]|nr:bifunctional 3-(3-hydroxy-phenyl)propionate/3-hydroxycinnamic acid hydroxylase [Actinomycetota bacterium]